MTDENINYIVNLLFDAEEKETKKTDIHEYFRACSRTSERLWSIVFGDTVEVAKNIRKLKEIVRTC